MKRVKRIDDLKGNTKEFAEACFAQNSAEELIQALLGPADGPDMKIWGITSAEWRTAIAAALLELFEQE